MIGKRCVDHDEFFASGPGAYLSVSVRSEGESFEAWFLKPPCGHQMFLAYDPRQGAVHEVDEHEDGTISVLPKTGNSNSILCHCGWHGYIRRGVFESV